MGNIVSPAAAPNQVPNAPGQGTNSPPSPGVAAMPLVAGTPPDLPNSTVPPVTSTTTIEGIDSAAQSGYHVDPFGPTPTSEPQLAPVVPEEVSSATAMPEIPTAETQSPPITPVSDENNQVRPNAATLLAQMPDITQMMKDLEKSGCLLPELQVKNIKQLDTSPLAALQPGHQEDKSFFSSPTDKAPLKVLPAVELTSSGKVKQAETHPELPLFVFVAVIAIVQAIQGLTQLTHFWLVKYPQFEQMIVANVITTMEIDAAVVRSALLGIFAAISLITGVLLLFKKSHSHSKLMYAVVTVIIINFVTQNVMGRGTFASGNPIQLPETIAEIMAARNQP